VIRILKLSILFLGAIQLFILYFLTKYLLLYFFYNMEIVWITILIPFIVLNLYISWLLIKKIKSSKILIITYTFYILLVFLILNIGLIGNKSTVNIVINQEQHIDDEKKIFQ